MSSLELTLVLVVIGFLTTLGVRGAGSVADRVAVEAAQGSILNAYRRTQSVARAWGRPAELVVTIDSLVIRVVTPIDTSVLWRAPGPGRDGISLTPSAHVTTFGPSGMATGAANVTHLLQRGAVSRRVVVSRLGRVKVG